MSLSFNGSLNTLHLFYSAGGYWEGSTSRNACKGTICTYLLSYFDSSKMFSFGLCFVLYSLRMSDTSGISVKLADDSVIVEQVSKNLD